jgi:lipopolysaccharide biosynthesis protein
MIQNKCQHILDEAQNIVVSACHQNVIDEIKLATPRAIVLKVTNKGKDIGGKLAALSYYYNYCVQTSYLAFLHDKISPQTLNAGYWFDKLFEIFDPVTLKNITGMFDKNRHTGIIGSAGFLKNEYSKSKDQFDTTNDPVLKELMQRYNIIPATFDYIGGTIFIARQEVFENFFKEHRPLKIRETLETGNVLDLNNGTNTHSWERLLCFIAQARGFKVAGV